MSRLLPFLFGAATGAAAAWFLDPDQGARRRSLATDKAGKYARQGTQQATSAATHAAAKAKGAAAHAIPTPSSAKDLDDVSLARKVETEIFRPADAPKGSVSVNAQNGVIELRGEVDDPDWIERLGEEARKVQGVKAVKNLLHRPGTAAPASEPGGARQR